MVNLKSDFERDYINDTIKVFKEVFGQYVDELLNGEHIDEVIEAIYENESNYNNCDPTSRQHVYDSSTIEEILKEILKIEYPIIEEFIKNNFKEENRDEVREILYKYKK